ncbi:uncharacterized protein LOC133789883 [Humulus lupulus]|uniref:uncharacterized protein LOC133789883 n=1 Tax=Humulus lupulus TaxID=3486 RepID=UPI002B416511|nr:uncharacterized protein LOC133789883 [Humulus lupulus]
MDPDLDTVLFSDEGAGAQKSKRPRASRRPDRPSKIPRCHEKTPTAQTTASTTEESIVQADASRSTALVSLPSTDTQITVGQPPKKPSVSKVQLPTARPHIEEFVLDGAAGTQGAVLSSDVLSQVGQSFSGFGADHWDLVHKASDYNTLYDKSIELTTAVSFATLL